MERHWASGIRYPATESSPGWRKPHWGRPNWRTPWICRAGPTTARQKRHPKSSTSWSTSTWPGGSAMKSQTSKRPPRSWGWNPFSTSWALSRRRRKTAQSSTGLSGTWKLARQTIRAPRQSASCCHASLTWQKRRQAASHIYRTGGIPWVLAVDVRDAFLNIPAGRDKSMSVAVRPDASGRNKLIICDTLVFGSKSSPTIWGRYASWLGRSWASIIHECCFQIYVDDPAIVAKGTFQQAASQVTCALLWAAVAGFPLKLSKAMGGKRIKWIGATITLDDDKSEVVVSIPSDKRAKLLEQCLDIAKKPVVSQKKLSALTGGLSFVAGLIPHLRPFLDTFWAALSSPLTKSANDGVGRPSGKLIHVRRFETGLQWVVALLQGDKVPLARTLKPICENIEAEVTTDASPWGLGGVLRVGGQLKAAFGCPLSDQLLTKFRARAGDPKYTTLWEAVALLTAFRLGLPQVSSSHPHQSGQFELTYHDRKGPGQITWAERGSSWDCAGPSTPGIRSYHPDAHPRGDQFGGRLPIPVVFT